MHHSIVNNKVYSKTNSLKEAKSRQVYRKGWYVRMIRFYWQYIYCLCTLQGNELTSYIMKWLCVEQYNITITAQSKYLTHGAVCSPGGFSPWVLPGQTRRSVLISAPSQPGGRRGEDRRGLWVDQDCFNRNVATLWSLELQAVTTQCTWLYTDGVLLQKRETASVESWSQTSVRVFTFCSQISWDQTRPASQPALPPPTTCQLLPGHTLPLPR